MPNNNEFIELSKELQVLSRVMEDHQQKADDARSKMASLLDAMRSNVGNVGSVTRSPRVRIQAVVTRRGPRVSGGSMPEQIMKALSSDSAKNWTSKEIAEALHLTDQKKRNMMHTTLWQMVNKSKRIGKSKDGGYHALGGMTVRKAQASA